MLTGCCMCKGIRNMMGGPITSIGMLAGVGMLVGVGMTGVDEMCMGAAGPAGIMHWAAIESCLALVCAAIAEAIPLESGVDDSLPPMLSRTVREKGDMFGATTTGSLDNVPTALSMPTEQVLFTSARDMKEQWLAVTDHGI